MSLIDTFAQGPILKRVREIIQRVRSRVREVIGG